MDRKSIDFSLNIKNLGYIPFHLYEKDFTFHFNGKAYKTNRFIADILSPYVRQLHYSDSSINEFYIELENEKIQERNSQTEEDYFIDFLKLCTFNNAKIDPNQQEYYAKYFFALGNIDEFFRLQPKYSDDIDENNAIDRLLLLSNIISKSSMMVNLPNTDTIQKIINFISSHFDNIDKEKMKLLNIDIILKIIDNENLKLHDEDSLLQFILDIYSKDDRFYELFEYVIFNNVSKKMIEKFITEFSIDHLNISIWKSICERLVGNSKSLSNRYDKKIDKNFKTVKFLHEKGKEFQGIMRYLIKETGGNIHDNGTVEITSNSIESNNYHPKNLVDYESEKYYGSDFNKKIMSFVCFDFKDKSVNLSSYTIKSNGNSDGLSNPRSWVVEVSNDGEKWDVIDRQENVSSLKGNKIEFTFNVQKDNYGFYRYIRVHQTGAAWERNDERVWFYSLEFYGVLKYPST